MTNEKKFYKLAHTAMKYVFIPLQLKEDLLNELWIVYAEISHKYIDVTDAFIIQKFKWYLIDQLRIHLKSPTTIELDSTTPLYEFTDFETNLIIDEFSQTLTKDELILFNLLLTYQPQKIIAKQLGISPRYLRTKKAKLKEKFKNFLQNDNT